MTVRTRFAPSPTGVLHLGSMRTALFSWLYARHNKGRFVLRIEDTDRERSTSENVEAILDGMAWIGMQADEGPIFQTNNFDRYAEVAADWLAEGHAYRCECSKERLDTLRAGQMQRGEKTRYDGRCRDKNVGAGAEKFVVRFRNPDEGDVVVEDRVRGEVVFSNSELDDLIIVRTDGVPTYNFTVVVDDFDMQITHVIRGDDHLNNTPRQMNMIQKLGAKPPVYAHLPMILGADGAKLSKRHGAVDIRDYRAQGYLPHAMLNYLVRLGWSRGDQELFSLEEMIRWFDIDDVNHSASSFNPDKLRWLNQQHIKAMPSDELGRELEPFLLLEGYDLANGPDSRDVADGFRERSETLRDMALSARYCYMDFDGYEAKAAKKALRPVILEPLKEVRRQFEALGEWTVTEIAKTINDVAVSFDLNMGKVGQPIRVAITGAGVSPPIDVTLKLVGRARTLARLDNAIEFVTERATQTG